jgi:HK97 family phage major capsid protein
VLNKLKEQRAAIKAALEALVNTAEGESRGMTDVESAEFDTKVAELRTLDERIAELQAAEVREAAAASHRSETAPVEKRETATVSVGHEPNPVYRRDSVEASYFKDVLFAGKGDQDARSRLARAQETRAGDLTSIAGTGGEFAPPAWLVEDYVALARPHRVTADILNQAALPKGIASINLPKVSTGSGAGVQATQNSALTDTALTTTSVSSGITLIAGRQIVSRQLIDQSGIPFDRVILQDLAADYAKQLDVQVLTGTGANGQLRGLTTAGTLITYTSSAPKVVDATTNANSFYSALVRAVNSVSSNRYLPANAIVMNPQRWAWVLEAVDSSGRPIVAPSGASFNALATAGAPVAEGSVGNLLGLNVYIDPNIPQTMNSATNQDAVYVLRTDDIWLYESDLEAASFEATYADNASVLFRVMGYSALIPDRYAYSISKILGTGLVTATL